MTTVIDSLVVTLGLDPSQFTKGQREALDAFKKTQEEAVKGGKSIEEQSKKSVDGLGLLKTQALELFAVFTGAVGLKDFISGTIQAGATVGRLSRAIGVSAGEIAKWQGVAREFGSTGENMAGAFQSLSNVFTAWQVGGPEAPGVMQILSVINKEAQRLDGNNAKIISSGKGVNQFYLDLADNLEIIHRLSQDKNMASYLALKLPGMDPGLIDALTRGGDKLAEMLKKVQGFTDDEAEAAGRLQQRWEALKVTAENTGLHWLFGGIDFATKAWDWQVSGGKRPFGSGSFTQPSVNSEQIGGAFTSPAQKEAFIRAEAIKRGQNPDVWVALAKSEGFANYFGDPDATGKPTSFGSMQLHYPGVGRNTADGLGSIFTKQTGLDARNPATEPQQIQWSMDWAKTHGLSDWHGWKGAQFANLSGGGSTSTTTINISDVKINAGPNASAADIAGKLRDLGMKRQAEANQSFVGGE